MKTLIVSGSHRKNSESGRVGEYLKSRLGSLNVSTDNHHLDLGKTPLPLWDEEAPLGNNAWKSAFEPILDKAKASDAIVLISPEWAGMATPAMMNFLLLASGTGALAHKPALIVTTSAARGGAYPISQLRSSGYKNTYLCVIPEQIIIRNVSEMLVDPTPSTQDDIYLRSRIDYALKLLGGYAKALAEVRSAGLVDTKTYPNGM